MVVAQAAGDRRASGEIVLYERANHFALEALLMIDYVVGNPDGLGHLARIVDVIQRTAASLHRFRHAVVPGQAALIPELHGQPTTV